MEGEDNSSESGISHGPRFYFEAQTPEYGSILPGFYATGNTTASVMGHSYPGAGATIAAAMTFGYVAVRHLVGDISEK